MTADTIGGVWTYALGLSRELTRAGVEVMLATMGRELSAGQWSEVRAIRRFSVRESGFKLEWMPSPWDDVDAAGGWLQELEAEFQPDLVHLNGYAHGGLPWKAPSIVVGHSCVYSWHESVRGCPPGPEWTEYHRRTSRSLARSAYVTAPTSAMLGAMKRIYGPFRAWGVIHNGATPEAVVPLPKEPFILVSGRLWDRAKNVRALDAIADGVPWPVLAAGEAVDPQGVHSEFPNLSLLGRLDARTMADIAGRASIFAAPALYEPFGLSILEAALAGCALVLGDIPSLRELWDGAATFVPPSASPQLHHAILSLIRNPSDLAGSGLQARTRALAYSSEAMRGGYLSLYADTLARGGPSGLSEKFHSPVHARWSPL